METLNPRTKFYNPLLTVDWLPWALFGVYFGQPHNNQQWNERTPPPDRRLEEKIPRGTCRQTRLWEVLGKMILLISRLSMLKARP